MTQTFQEAIEEYKPELEREFVEFFTRRYNQLIAEYGPAFSADQETMMRYDRDFIRQSLSQFLFNTDEDGNRFSIIPRDAVIYKMLNTERLAQVAAEYAEDTTVKWIAKILKKLGQLDEYKLGHLKGGDIMVWGYVDGHCVELHQQVVYKMSAKGTYYNQFPARLYVDGKFTPESKFKSAIGHSA